MNYLVYSTDPGTCHLYTVFGGDKSVMGMTLQDIKTEHPERDFELIDEPEFLRRLDAHYDTYKTPWCATTKEQWWDLLECLPPCRWHHAGGAELFHVSERLTGNLVTWCMRIKDRYYTCTQDADALSSYLVNLPIQQEAA